MGSIYAIVNKINGRMYIGRTKKFKSRLAQHNHMLSQGEHENRLINEDLQKYGKISFEIYEIENVSDNNKLYQLEIDYIKKHNTCVSDGGFGYNISSGGEFSSGGVKLSDEIKNEISKKMKGRKFSKEHSRKKSEAQIGSSNPIAKRVSVNGKIYECIKYVSVELSLKHNTVIYRLNSKSERFKDWFYL
jgi:group I intron endonuclease